jgi:hypothetical protein
MKKALSIFLLALMVGVGVLLVYQEVHAKIFPCLMAQDYCIINCEGVFSLGDCWQYQGETYCWFTCNRIWIHACGWADPTVGECAGGL